MINNNEGYQSKFYNEELQILNTLAAGLEY